MMQDFRTILWKESKGLMYSSGSAKRTLITQLFSIGIVAIVLPLQMKTDWLVTGFSLIVAIVVPLMLVGTTIPASFAGEREKNTLETLLASRLPDRVILFGKMLVAVLYGWMATILILLISMVVVNILFWQGKILFFETRFFLADLVLSLVFSVFVASLGVNISLKAPTTQGAQQTLLFSILVPLMILQVIPVVLFSVLPNGRDIIDQIVQAVSFNTLVLVLGTTFLVLCVGLLYLAVSRFQRSKLLSA